MYVLEMEIGVASTNETTLEYKNHLESIASLDHVQIREWA